MFYVATRKVNAGTGTSEITVEHYMHIGEKDAVRSATEHASRNNYLRRNVIVVEATDDTDALRKARETFKRGG